MSSYSYDRVAPSINSADRQALTSIDADTTDYYDGPGGELLCLRDSLTSDNNDEGKWSAPMCIRDM
jgi:hypothetical protein